MKAVNIEWDVDCEEDLETLPKEIEIPKEIECNDDETNDYLTEISDYITNITGFCHKGFSLADSDGSKNESKPDRLTQPTKDYECRMKNCAAEDWMYYIFGEFPKDVCEKCPFQKLVNRLAEYEDKEK